MWAYKLIKIFSGIRRICVQPVARRELNHNQQELSILAYAFSEAGSGEITRPFKKTNSALSNVETWRKWRGSSAWESCPQIRLAEVEIFTADAYTGSYSEWLWGASSRDDSELLSRWGRKGLLIGTKSVTSREKLLPHSYASLTVKLVLSVPCQRRAVGIQTCYDS